LFTISSLKKSTDCELFQFYYQKFDFYAYLVSQNS
jgi:hypothetical protein